MGEPGKKIEWFLDELVFIKKNFHSLNATEMLEHINKNRIRQIGKSKLREKYRELGFQKHPRPKLWLDRETRFLLNNYHKMGNVEICKRLNKYKNRSRDFTPKIIWKKMQLLKIKRTQKDLIRIKKKNIKKGGYRHPRFGMKHHNYVPEGKVAIWYGDKRKRKYKWIKYQGKMVQYHRFVYKKFIGPIPEGHNVYFKDGNTLNCKPENLFSSKPTKVIYKKDIKPIPDIFLKPDKAVNKSKSSIHKFNYKPQIAI